MKTTNTDILSRNRVFLLLAIATGLVLLAPLAAMQFTDDVAWTLTDFITFGGLLFSSGLVFVLAARMTQDIRRRLLIAVIVGGAFLYVWAELAVGIFTNWGS